MMRILSLSLFPYTISAFEKKSRVAAENSKEIPAEVKVIFTR